LAPLFKRATDIDPEFAMAHSYLGRMYANLEESDLAAQSMKPRDVLHGFPTNGSGPNPAHLSGKLQHSGIAVEILGRDRNMDRQR
jgi:hypothetical protein